LFDRLQGSGIYSGILRYPESSNMPYVIRGTDLVFTMTLQDNYSRKYFISYFTHGE